MADYDTALRVVWTFLKLDHVHGQSVLLDTLPQGGVGNFRTGARSLALVTSGWQALLARGKS